MNPEVWHYPRYLLPFSSNRFNGIFSEHALEHLYPDEAFNLLNEIYRCLKIRGTLRLSLPNTEKSLRKQQSFYVEGTKVKKKI